LQNHVILRLLRVEMDELGYWAFLHPIVCWKPYRILSWYSRLTANHVLTPQIVRTDVMCMMSNVVMLDHFFWWSQETALFVISPGFYSSLRNATVSDFNTIFIIIKTPVDMWWCWCCGFVWM